MQVGDVLRKKTSRVVTVRMNETVAIAAQLMRANNISALVVKDVVRTECNTAVGMFTERDVVRAVADHGSAGLDLKISKLISLQLVCCSLTDTTEHIRHLMNENHMRHLPVIDNYSLIGVISISDIAGQRAPTRCDAPFNRNGPVGRSETQVCSSQPNVTNGSTSVQWSDPSLYDYAWGGNMGSPGIWNGHA